MPASFSAPIEPYLKRISGVAVTQSGCGSSRKILYQAVKPTIAPSSSNTSSVHQSQRGFHWNDFFAAGEGVAMTVSCGRSERLEERHQRVLVGFGKLGAVSGAFVACIGVARHGGVVAEELDALARGHVGYEADVDRVVDVVAAPERLGPRGRRIQPVETGRASWRESGWKYVWI